MVSKRAHCAKITFLLLDIDREEKITESKYKEAWFTSNKRRIKWKIIVPPFKLSFCQAKKCLSELIESIQKGIECLFGILKQHFRMLKTGITVQKIELARMIFKTACTMCNILLEIDRIK